MKLNSTAERTRGAGRACILHSWKKRSLSGRPSGEYGVMARGEGLTCVPFFPSCLRRSKQRGPAACCAETASAPSCTCCWGHPALLPRLCMRSCARQDPTKASPSVSHCLLGPRGHPGHLQHWAGREQGLVASPRGQTL